MISANEIRNKKIADASNGYDKMEVNILLDEASDTIDAYVRQNEDLYHKMEVLANKIEEYRAEEDLIKTAIIKAEKTAEEIRSEAKQKADVVIKEASDKSTEILDAANAAKLEVEKAQTVANEQAEKIIATARETAAEIIRQKTEEGNAIIADAEKRANEAINSSKIVAQNILDQAKEISDDLVSKSKEEKEAYEILVDALKSDAKVFLENVKSLYNEQLEALNNAKLDHESEEKIESVENVNDLQEEVESLVSEMEEIESAIPSSITIDAPIADVQTEESAEEEIFEEVFEEIVRDKDFFENSGGGVTFSGGECMLQIDFLCEILKKCKENGIHTAVDTAGNVKWECFEKILPFTDLFLYDIKSMDPEIHRRYTGVGNELILDNLKILLHKGKHIWIRVPIIPSVNDSADNILKLKEFLAQNGNVEKIELLPYHRMCENKYNALNEAVQVFDVPEPKHMESLKKLICGS